MTDAGFWSEFAEWITDPQVWSGPGGIPARLIEHLVLSAVAVTIAAVLALPVAMYIGHRRRFEFVVVSTANLGRAIPSLGLIVLFVILFGLQLDWPAALRPSIVAAMVLLAIPPILTNAYVGIQGVEPDLLESARGMGMREREVLRRIELPLGAPLIVAGLRTATVQVIATATLSAIAAGGGLGRFIVDGTAQRDMEEIFGGALLVALLAISAEVGFSVLERAVTPRTTSRRERRPRPATVASDAGPAA